MLLPFCTAGGSRPVTFDLLGYSCAIYLAALALRCLECNYLVPCVIVCILIVIVIATHCIACYLYRYSCA
jgi:hypothetical protein